LNLTTIVVNGAPHNVDLGIKDSTRVRGPREALAIPQHLPKIYIFAERGKEDEWLGGGAERERRYGAKTFDERSRFFTHQSKVSNVVNAVGNLCMYKRVIPADAGPAANVALYLDVFETTVDLYERNSDGSIKTVNGQPVITGQAPGFKYKFVTVVEETISGFNDSFGTRTIVEGDQFDPNNPTVRSQRYPIMEFGVNSRGAWGNNIGLRIWPLDKRSDSLPEKMIARERAFPFRLQLVERDPFIGSVNTIDTALADGSVLFTLKSGSVDPSTNKYLYMGTQFPAAYQQKDERYPAQDSDIDKFALYQDNIDLLTTMFHEAEKDYIDLETHDFTDADSDSYLFNLFTGKSLGGVEYHTYRAVTGGVSFSRYETIYLGGASDGTLSNENFEALVTNEIRRYLDANDILQEKAYHVESNFYDAGFSLETKMELAAFIALRKDTFLTLGTFQEDDDREYDNSEKLSIAQSLKARLANLPESSYFGTEVVRAGIYAGSCEWRGSTIPGKRTTPVLEVAHKRARYMGAANGRWTTQLHYDQGSPGSLCEITFNYDSLWVPVEVRYRFWDAGLNWVGYFDRQQPWFPAFRTVYSDDSSLLTADSFVQCLCHINKINDRSWRAHSGTVGVPEAVFVQRVSDWIIDATRGLYDDRFPIVPEVTVTEADRARGGYSWHSNIKVYGDPMRTVAVTSTEAFRREDL
jgi:hypothetical protein